MYSGHAEDFFGHFHAVDGGGDNASGHSAAFSGHIESLHGGLESIGVSEESDGAGDPGFHADEGSLVEEPRGLSVEFPEGQLEGVPDGGWEESIQACGGESQSIAGLLGEGLTFPL